MRSLHRAGRDPDRGGAPLPMPFRSFDQYDFVLRRGELTMIAAPPGAGKSTIALALAMKMRVPTFYFSLDSGEKTQKARMLAMITGLQVKQCAINLELDPQRSNELLSEHAPHIKWDFDAQSMWDVEEELNVYQEVMGGSPWLIVLDNATDISYESGDEYSSLRSLMRDLKQWARDLNASLMVLHHTSEGFDGNPCPPLRSIHGKVSQKPANVLTIGEPVNGLMPVAPVKNRNGSGDRSGNTAVWLHYDPSTMTLKDVDV